MEDTIKFEVKHLPGRKNPYRVFTMMDGEEFAVRVDAKDEQAALAEGMRRLMRALSFRYRGATKMVHARKRNG